MTTHTDTRTYSVRGMSCGHCASAVRQEVGGLAGVDDVSVDLAEGRLEVRGNAGKDAVARAVRAAGYELADR